MRVLIDSGPLSTADSFRGIGVYTRELINSLTKSQGGDFRFETKKNVDTDLSKYDVVHFTAFKPFSISLPFAKPAGTRFVLTIYDLIPLVYPTHYPPGLKGWLNWQINRFLVSKNVDAIVTISETSKKDVCRFIGVEPDKVYVTYLAPRSIFKKMGVVKHFDLPQRFALYVGDINYNKNISNLVKACELAKIPLVIAGRQAEEVEKLDLGHPELRHLKNVSWKNVHRLGFVPDDDLVSLYNQATVYVQPSFYEGFGLPLLEAIACRTPVAVARNQCHVEILGEHFNYFDPKDPEDIARSILNPNIGRKLPHEYSWRVTAEKTLEVYAKI